jgi:hypothetical protein
MFILLKVFFSGDRPSRIGWFKRRRDIIFILLIFLMRYRATIFMAGMMGLASCGGNKDDVTDTVNRAGAVETAVSVQHADSTHDVLLTTHKIWVNFHEFRTVVHQDTLPALGIEHTTAENEEGDKKRVSIKKDYEIYITLK